MSDLSLTDITPFFERHERRFRRALGTLVCASVVVATGIFAYGVLTTAAPGTLVAKLWPSVLFYPLFGVVFWTGTALYARMRRLPPGGRPLMNATDARSVAHVARAGFIFLVCMGLIMIATQAGLALGYFGILRAPDTSGVWITRAGAAATGVLMIYFGNAWSRTPMPRAPAQNAAAMMKFKRHVAWLVVIYGLLLALGALFLPRPMILITHVVLTLSLVLAVIGSVLILHNALKSRRAS